MRRTYSRRELRFRACPRALIFVLALADIGERYPASRRGFIPNRTIIGHVQRRKSTQRILHFTKWFPTHHGHGESSYKVRTSDDAVTLRWFACHDGYYGEREEPP